MRDAHHAALASHAADFEAEHCLVVLLGELHDDLLRLGRGIGGVGRGSESGKQGLGRQAHRNNIGCIRLDAIRREQRVYFDLACSDASDGKTRAVRGLHSRPHLDTALVGLTVAYYTHNILAELYYTLLLKFFDRLDDP